MKLHLVDLLILPANKMMPELQDHMLNESQLFLYFQNHVNQLLLIHSLYFLMCHCFSVNTVHTICDEEKIVYCLFAVVQQKQGKVSFSFIRDESRNLSAGYRLGLTATCRWKHFSHLSFLFTNEHIACERYCICLWNQLMV